MPNNGRPETKAEVNGNNANGNRMNNLFPRENDSELNLKHIYTENRGRMLAIAYNILRNMEDSEDAVQSAFLKFHVHYDQFRWQSKPSTYLFTIVVNEAFMILRRPERRTHEISLEQKIGDLTMEIPELSVHDKNHGNTYSEGTIERIVSKLPPEQRKALILADYLDCTSKEASQILNCSVSSIKTRLHRARKKIRKLLNPHYITRHEDDNNGNYDMHSEAISLQRAFLLKQPGLEKYAPL